MVGLVQVSITGITLLHGTLFNYIDAGMHIVNYIHILYYVYMYIYMYIYICIYYINLLHMYACDYCTVCDAPLNIRRGKMIVFTIGEMFLSAHFFFFYFFPF